MSRIVGLRTSQDGLTAAQKSAEGIVGGTSFAEGLNAGRTLGCGDLASATRSNSRYLAFNSRYLAFRATGKSEARTALLEGTEADTAGSPV